MSTDAERLAAMRERLFAIGHTGGCRYGGEPGPGTTRHEVLARGDLKELRALDAEAADLALQIELLDFQLQHQPMHPDA